MLYIVKENSNLLDMLNKKIHEHYTYHSAFTCCLGIALMMWNTFLVKRFSAATYLMDKVG